MSKKNWKKYALGMVTASTALLLAACGGEDTGTDDTGTDGGTDDAATEESTDEAATGDLGGELTVTVGADYIDFINEIAPAFEDETGVSLSIEEREMFETLDGLSLDGPAGLAPDVTIAPYDRIGGLGQKGHLHEVTLADDGRYDETDEQQVSADDTVFGSPYVVEALIMYYNTDLLDEAPTTFEELEAISEKIIHKKGYKITAEAMKLMLDITEYYRLKPNFANARTVRNIIDQVIMNQNLRTEDMFENDLIIPSDVEDYLSDEGIDLTATSSNPHRIGFI